MKLKSAAGILSVVLMLSGCATFPPGPSVMVLPGNGKPFEAFQADDSVCRQWAQNRTEWNANQTANENLAGGAIVGGALGAASGALIGAASGNVGPGAAIGAGAGLLRRRHTPGSNPGPHLPEERERACARFPWRSARLS